MTPRAIAVAGAGYEPAVLARQGLWPIDEDGGTPEFILQVGYLADIGHLGLG